MVGYEGLGDLLSNSIRYGLSNKKAIIIWGIAYIAVMVIYILGIVASLFFDDRMVSVAIILLSVIPALLMGVLFLGYFHRILSGLLGGDSVVPEISDLAGMTVNGIKILVIYSEGVILMMILFIPMMLILMLADKSAAATVFCLLYPVVVVLCILVGGVNLVQWAIFADTDSLLSGLNPLTALRLVLGDLRYAAVAVIAAIILYIVFSVAMMALFMLIVTIVLLPFLMIPIYCAGIYILARFYQHASGMGPQGTSA